MSSKRRFRQAARLAFVLSGVAAAESGALAQDADAGRALYTANGCFQCHGYDGQGGVAGPRIAPSPYPYLAFAQLVRRPADVMPAYAVSVLSDDDLREIFQYVSAIQEPPAVDEIPALR